MPKSYNTVSQSAIAAMRRGGTVDLPGGGVASEEEALAGLCREARLRGTTYGLLVANTTEWERLGIRNC